MRIFFGATLPENTKKQIEKIQEEVRTSICDIKIESSDKLHITLQFVGDFDPQKVNGLFSAVERKIEESAFKSAVTEIMGMSYFPNEKIRRGIWIDSGDDGTLARIAESIKGVTAQFGVIPENRTFKPHITIGRFRGGGDRRRKSSFSQRNHAGDLQKVWSDGKLSIERFFPLSIALFESILKSSGSEYKILFDIPLDFG